MLPKSKFPGAISGGTRSCSEEPAYRPLGPVHSFLHEDAEPLTPGEAATIRFSLYPTSVLLHKGHRIRIALAGADASLFQRYPEEGTPVWTIYREARRASFLELPVRRTQ
jgi:predicted acyl esterase